MWNNIQRFATDRLNDLKHVGGTISDGMEHAASQLRDGASQLRDEVIVPAIDTAMEEGVIPGDVGMYGRYLTGTQVPLTKFPADVRAAEQEKVNKLLELNRQSFDPRNYKMTGYSDFGMVEGEGTNNTLGQYRVKDGIVVDRYDFDRNNFYGDGTFEHGGIYGQPRIVESLAGTAGNLSQRLGLVKPGSGYDVRLDTGRR